MCNLCQNISHQYTNTTDPNQPPIDDSAGNAHYLLLLPLLSKWQKATDIIIPDLAKKDSVLLKEFIDKNVIAAQQAEIQKKYEVEIEAFTKKKAESFKAITAQHPEKYKELEKLYYQTYANTEIDLIKIKSYTSNRFIEAKILKKFIRFKAVIDERTTVICNSRNDITLPADNPFWLSNTPPLHHFCRSVLEILDKAVTEIQPKASLKQPEGNFGNYKKLFEGNEYDSR